MIIPFNKKDKTFVIWRNFAGANPHFVVSVWWYWDWVRQFHQQSDGHHQTGRLCQQFQKCILAQQSVGTLQYSGKERLANILWGGGSVSLVTQDDKKKATIKSQSTSWISFVILFWTCVLFNLYPLCKQFIILSPISEAVILILIIMNKQCLVFYIY